MEKFDLNVEFSIWETIKPIEVRENFYSGSFLNNNWLLTDKAHEMINSLTASSCCRKTLNLTILSPKKLGFKSSLTGYNTFCDSAFSRGLEKCPPDTALNLFHVADSWIYKETIIKGRSLLIVSDCISDSGFGLNIFCIYPNIKSENLLDGQSVGYKDEVKLYPNQRLVFCFP